MSDLISSQQILRQGDVLLARIEALPPRFVPAPLCADGSATLAHGEVTGHRHRLERAAGPDGAALAMQLYEHPLSPGEPAAVCLAGAAQIVHEEHATLPLPAGTYLLSRLHAYTGTGMRLHED